MDPILLAAAVLIAESITTDLTAALGADGITLNALSITLEGAFMNVTFNGDTQDIAMPGGWRGRGHLTADPVNYLHMMARNAFGLET